MSRTSGIGTIVDAVVDALRASAAVTALVPAERIANVIPSGTPRPYLLVDVETELDDDTLSLGGVDAVCSVTPVSEYSGSWQLGQIASAVRAALDAQPLDVEGFEDGPADCTFEQSLGEIREQVAGITVRRRPLWFRVRAL